MTVLIDVARDLQRSENGQRAADLSARYEDMTPQEILRDAIRNQFFGDITLSSSFEADSAVLLHIVSEIDPNRETVVHCKMGGRSAKAIHELEDNFGFTNLYNLKGGILGWIDEVQPELTKY